MAVDGLTTLPSSHGPKETMNRFEADVKAKGMTVFARIDHAAGATGARRTIPVRRAPSSDARSVPSAKEPAR